MKQIVTLVAAGALALGLVLGVAAPAVAQECLSKREIQEKIDNGELIQLSQAMAASGVDGKIISSQVKVCQVGGQWEWQVNVMDEYGESKPVSLPMPSPTLWPLRALLHPNQKTSILLIRPKRPAWRLLTS